MIFSPCTNPISRPGTQRISASAAATNDRFPWPAMCRAPAGLSPNHAPASEREGKCHLRCKPKGSTEYNIGPLLYPDRVGDREGDGTDSIEQALDHDDRREIERGAGEAQGDPNLDRQTRAARRRDGVGGDLQAQPADRRGRSA